MDKEQVKNEIYQKLLDTYKLMLDETAASIKTLSDMRQDDLNPTQQLAASQYLIDKFFPTRKEATKAGIDMPDISEIEKFLDNLDI